MKCYDTTIGWYEVSDDDVTLVQSVEWSWGDIEVAGIQVMLTESFLCPVFAQVTVWFRGVGTPHYVADPASLAAYIATVMPGVKALAEPFYPLVEFGDTN